VTELLDDIMKVFLPAAKTPTPFVPCSYCPELHILLSEVHSGNTIFCPVCNDNKLAGGYYSDLGDRYHNSKLELFTNYYERLLIVLPKTLSKHFVSEKIINFEEEEEIQQDNVKPEVASSVVLRKIACGLKAGLTRSFEKLLFIMEKYGDISCVELANEMNLKLLDCR